MIAEQAHTRLYGLDNWRAILLLVGPIIHGAQTVPFINSPPLWIEDIELGSHMFRMEAFFAISGFLAAHAANHDSKNWLINRCRVLFVPLVTTLLLTQASVHWFRSYSGAASPQFSLYHLWFLVDLIIITVIFWVLSRSSMRVAVSRPAKKLAISVVAISACTSFVLEHVLYHAFPAAPDGVAVPLFFFPRMALFYYVGFVSSKTDWIRDWFQTTRTSWLGPVLLVGSLTLVDLHIEWWNDSGSRHVLFKILIYMCSGLACVGMVFTVLSTALRTYTQSRWLHKLSKSAYTVFLFHMPIIFVIVPIIAKLSVSPVIQFLLVAGLSMVGSLIIHFCMIDKSNLLKFLFNGRSYAHNQHARASL